MTSRTKTGVEHRRSSSVKPKPQILPFPDFHTEKEDGDVVQGDDISRGPSPAPLMNGLPAGLHSSERWPLNRASKRYDVDYRPNGRLVGAQHGRQKSLTEAIRTVRTRKASISESASEIAESLKAPVSPRLVLLCTFWYGTSILTNASSKAILTAFPKPVTLTIVQFYLVCFWCLFLSWLARRSAAVRNAMPLLKNGIRRPSKDIIMATLPLTAFQIGGHILNSDAMALIDVSLVHTIKGLSPLMTVIAYRMFFDIRYSIPTYLSLIPLTIGVILACSASFQGNIVGLTYAFGSAILFVTQNIVSKSVFTEAAIAEKDGTPIGRRKPDKLNLLCYSSGLAFLFTFPIWLWSEGFTIAADFLKDGSIDLRKRPGSLDHGALTVEYMINGTFHFSQSLVAFILLGLTSPVTYSVASLIKRVAVILFAIVWFGKPMTTVQGFGFALTFVGLYLYDRTSDAAKADKRARAKAEANKPLLPMVSIETKAGGAQPTYMSPLQMSDASSPDYDNGNRNTRGRPNGHVNGRPVENMIMNTAPASMLPGTKAEETWSYTEFVQQHQLDVR